MKNICNCKVVVFSLGFFSLIVIKVFCFYTRHCFCFFVSLNSVERITIFWIFVSHCLVWLNCKLIVLTIFALLLIVSLTGWGENKTLTVQCSAEITTLHCTIEKRSCAYTALEYFSQTYKKHFYSRFRFSFLNGTKQKVEMTVVCVQFIKYF